MPSYRLQKGNAHRLSDYWASEFNRVRERV
jgi:hypothetical protein